MKIGFFGAGIYLGTGYGQGIYNMAKGLMAQGHEVFQYAIQYSGFPISVNGIKIYAGASDADLKRSILATKPDFVVYYGDLWIYTPYTTMQMQYHHIVTMAHEAGAKMVNWSPLHAVPVVKEFEESIEKEGDFCLFTTKWASDYFRSRGHSNVDYLYHPIGDFHAVRIEKRPFNLPDGTMMMHVGYALDQRKMTPLILLLLKRYLDVDSRAFAYLHTQIRSYFANDVFIQGLGIPKEKVVFPPYNDPSSAIHGLSEKDMNLLYNSADVYINLSSAEGFDVPAVEAGSVGLPVIVTDSPVHREVLEGYNARFVRVAGLIPEPLQWESLADVDDAFGNLLDLSWQNFRKSKAHIREEFTIPYASGRLVRILESI